MPFVVIRVELHGSPSTETYRSVHAVMERKGWWPSITSDDERSDLLPADMYCGHTDDVDTLARELKSLIVLEGIWAQPRVFVMQVTNWSMTRL